MNSYDAVKELRKRILTVSHYGNDGNLQSVFSSLDVMWLLYDKVLNCSPENCKDDNRDFFILSKGQATLGLFAVLEKKGFFSPDELNSFCEIDSRFAMQADRTKFSGGIEISAGSLGHGFPMAVGIAMASKIKKLQNRIYCLVGDGEFNEGTMWEAALLAGGRKLDNITVIIDDNNSIGAMLDMGDMSEKLKAFGFDVVTIDGHNHKEIKEALSEKRINKPRAIIAKTLRGYGSKTMMTDNRWFHRSPDKNELDNLLKEVTQFETGNV